MELQKEIKKDYSTKEVLGNFKGHSEDKKFSLTFTIKIIIIAHSKTGL